MSSYQDRLLKVIPGGAHTYSRGFDQFPSNAPQILARGKGVNVYDPDGREYLDYGMGLRSVSIGYAEQEITAAALRQVENGNNLTRPSLIELEAAERMVDLIDSIDMVKFAKSGSAAVSAAVKLARAYTGRELIARCVEHPFLSGDDWFIGSTPITRGSPKATLNDTQLFHYNDLPSFETLLDRFTGQFACVVMEAATIEHPKDDFLHRVQALCRQHGIVFVIDEMITGFRWHLKGAQHYYGIQPDLCTFGKAMANGFAVSAVAGRREIMELGSIEFEGRERVFLLSTTHGSEMSGLGALVATLDFMKRHAVVEHVWDYGSRLIAMFQRQALAHGVAESFKAGGLPCSPYYWTLDANGSVSLPLRTLFLQEMTRHGVLIPWIALSYRHGADELAITERAVDQTFAVYRRALDGRVEDWLKGPAVKPVFRRFN